MTIGLSPTLRNGIADLIRNGIDGGSGDGYLRVYSGTRPATGGALGGAVLLAEFRFADPSAPNASGGVSTFNGLDPETSAPASGTPSWGRILDSDETFLLDIDVHGPSGSGGELVLTTDTLVAGQTVTVSTFTLTAPNP